MRAQERGVASPRQNSKIMFSCKTGGTSEKENVADGGTGPYGGSASASSWANNSSTNASYKQTGSYEIKTQGGKVYVGKGSMQRMQVSIRRLENSGYIVNRGISRWDPAPSDQMAFVHEYLKMAEYAFDFGGQLINKIMSPGMNIFNNWF